MEPTKDFVIAYVLWTAEGSTLLVSSFMLNGHPWDKPSIMKALKEQTNSIQPLDWSLVQAVSYNIFEPLGIGSYNRYNCWLDKAELEEGVQVAQATISLVEPVGVAGGSEALIEEVEEILREDRTPGSEPEKV